MIDYTFEIDGFYHSVNYYRSLTPMDVGSMPTPTQSGITGLSYSDASATSDKLYFVRFGSVKGDIEKISEEIKINTYKAVPTVVGSTASTFTTSTSQSKAIPSGTKVGDLVLAFVMHRENITPPAGWELVEKAECKGSTGLQYSSVYKKIASVADLGANITFTQASSQRLSLALMSFNHASGCQVMSVVKLNYLSQVGAKSDFANFTAPRNGVAVNFGSWFYTSTNTSTNYSVDNDYTAIGATSTSDRSNQIRSGIGYKALNMNELNTGSFLIESTANFDQSKDTACCVSFLVTPL